ncbi:aryl-sulfate sulfotransferase [Piscinibacter terrae]|uniref:ArsR family transcriptional regulator n=1 Tax=Piscinibacter terrae TaxID=2496871 RepID=A0A3N7HLN5_9BURK|nr:aryl-sulfate sulfotransferase [Albitalea terrae]RQP21511.1 ArsR family transcriptional regulator [Albitalea terrae]
MSRQRFIRRALTALTLAASICAALAYPSVFPTGTTRYDPARAWNSYVLFTGGDNVARLIDLNGNVVREWKDAGTYSSLLDPAHTNGQRGHVLVTLALGDGSGTDLVPGRVATRISKSIGELDWNGQVVWQFGEKAPGGFARQHNDWGRLPNGNTVVLSNVTRPLPGFKLPQLIDDAVYEVNAQGEIVWRWLAGDHLDEFGFTPEQLKLVRAAEEADFLHLNNLKALGPNRWFTAGDKRFAPDNLLVHSRNANFIAIIEKASGKVVWTLGPNYPAIARGAASRKLPRPVDQISGQHDAHLIPEGLPGAGNLLVFDNQGPAGYPSAALPTTGGSRILEIDPVKKEIVWQYSAEDSGAASWTFRSTHISAARRLPNGNTFIDEGQSGRLFQVTPDGEIVWEYVNPYPRVARDPATGKRSVNHQVYRGQPVPYDWVPAGTPHQEKAVVPASAL